jgi:molybdopterin-dependent oxidoreductase alpha subunit
MSTYRRTKPGGGWPAIFYTLDKALKVGPWRLWQRMRARNACKTCAMGMGGQLGGMVNEANRFPEVCKKSLQAQVADMLGAIPVDFFEKNNLQSLLALSPKQAEDRGRLIYPIMLAPGDTHFKPVSWDTAITVASEAIKTATPERSAFYSSGRSSNEAAFLLQSFARVFGTNNVMNCSFYCHQASALALKMAFGSGTATITLEDVDKADLVFLCGTNPASNHPRLMTQLAELRKRGGQVIVVNPVRESGLEKFHVPSKPLSLLFGSEIASLYIQPLAGGDVAFFIGTIKALLEKNQVNREFIEQHSTGAEEVFSQAESHSWDELTKVSGVDHATMAAVAESLARSKSTIFTWAMGLTHHENGVDNVLALCNLAIATGNVGRPGAGMLPLRGHSNVQGVGSVGFAPTLQDGVRAALERAYQKPMPSENGLDTYSMIEAAGKGRIEMLFALGGNLWGSNPNLAWASDCMQKINTTIYLSTKLNPGHFHGRGQTTLILPVFARDEEPQATSQESMFNFVRLSEGGTPSVAGSMRAESEIICEIANRVLGDKPVDWSRLRSHKEVRKLLSEVIPGWQEIGQIDETQKEFTISGRIFHTPVFPTDTGRANMHPTPLPKFPADTLRLITFRSEGQFNTVVYEERDIYRGIPHRNCILVSGEDASRLAVRDGQRVTIRGEAGKLDNIEVVFGKIKPGVVAMFYPESNQLIKAKIDPRSKTPAFKSAPVWIER